MCGVRLSSICKMQFWRRVFPALFGFCHKAGSYDSIMGIAGRPLTIDLLRRSLCTHKDADGRSVYSSAASGGFYLPILNLWSRRQDSNAGTLPFTHGVSEHNALHSNRSGGVYAARTPTKCPLPCGFCTQLCRLPRTETCPPSATCEAAGGTVTLVVLISENALTFACK